MGSPLRVGVNLLWLRPGVVGGSEVAAVATVRALGGIDEPGLNLRLYAQRSFRTAHPDVADVITTTTSSFAERSLARRVAVETCWLPGRVRADGVDVVHFYGGVVPPGYRRPSVLTVHDTQPLENPVAFDPVKRRWLGAMIPSSVRRATVVAVPSAFVRDRLVEVVGVDPVKVVVIPHGADGVVVAEPVPQARIRARFRLDGPVVLYPAITYAHKNHAMLIEAFARVVAREPRAVLVLTGGAGDAEDDLVRLVEARGIADRVRRIGRVDDRELDALLRVATVLAFPSRYEGFGLPVLEAFAADVPVVASTAGSLPEVVGDAGVSVDPGDVAGWTDALLGALRGAQDSEDATTRRRERTRRFSWRHTAQRSLEAYRCATGERGLYR